MNLNGYHVVNLEQDEHGAASVSASGIVRQSSANHVLVQWQLNGKNSYCRMLTHQQLEASNIFPTAKDRDVFLDTVFKSAAPPAPVIDEPASTTAIEGVDKPDVRELSAERAAQLAG